MLRVCCDLHGDTLRGTGMTVREMDNARPRQFAQSRDEPLSE